MGSRQLIETDAGPFQLPGHPAERAWDAYMSTKRDERYYNMNHEKRGFAVILNHENFDTQKKRDGTNYDCENLKKQLERLHFDVEVYNDLEYNAVTDLVKELSTRDHSQNDCFVMTVLSHGNGDSIYTKNHLIGVECLWNSFTADKVPTLAGKPKLFFIQACQGHRTDYGITLHSNPSTETDGEAPSYRIPVQADFLFAYSTVPGYYSFRDTEKGTWFIQSLCQELEKNGFDHDLLTMLTSVNRRVALEFEAPDYGGAKEIPCFHSRLTRHVQFTKK